VATDPRFECDGCGSQVAAADLYSLIINLPRLRDAGIGSYCEDCAAEIADQGTGWFDGDH